MYRVMFRVDGGSQNPYDEGRKQGLGHITRCLGIAQELAKYNAEFSFVMRAYNKGIEKVSQNGFGVEIIPLSDLSQEGKNTLQHLGEFNPNIVVIDLHKTSASEARYISEIKRRGIKILSIDDNGPGRRYADILIYSLTREPTSYKQQQKQYSGPSYMGLNPAFQEFHNKPKRIRKDVKSILLTFGGADPKGVTLKAIQAIDGIGKDYTTTVVTGPFFMYSDKLKKQKTELKNKFIFRESLTPQEMAQQIFEADIALCSGGVTPYELACVGTPAIVILQNRDIQTREVSYRYGTAINLGLANTVTEKRIQRTISHLANDFNQRKKMLETGKKLVDGKGSERIAKIILDAIE